MFVSDTIVYVQLQKTGSTHIAELFSRFVGGKKKGKHNKPKSILMQSSRKFISSIRNPWEWYVSLWTYGCDGRGGLCERLFATKNAEIWRHCYADSRRPELFRQWLGMVYNPSFTSDLGEGYGKSKVFGVAGFYTFRYLNLCCRNIHTLPNEQLQSVNDLLLFERNNCYISQWIRTESLERDFIDIVLASGRQITRDDEELIRSLKRINTSSKNHPTRFYFDDEAIQAVAEKEALIIRKFGYTFPGTDTASGKDTASLAT